MRKDALVHVIVEGASGPFNRHSRRRQGGSTHIPNDRFGRSKRVQVVDNIVAIAVKHALDRVKQVVCVRVEVEKIRRAVCVRIGHGQRISGNRIVQAVTGI
jgi:hypothetical protein